MLSPTWIPDEGNAGTGHVIGWLLVNNAESATQLQGECRMSFEVHVDVRAYKDTHH